MKKSILYILAILALASCKKIESDLENSGSTTPIYKVQGTVNDQPFDLTVDNTNVLMAEGSESMNGVHSFYTEFQNTENATALKITVLAPEKIYKAITDYNIEDRQLSYLVHEPGCYELGYSMAPPDPPIIIYEQDGNFISGESLVLPGFGIYDIPVRFKGLSNETFQVKINHGFEADAFSADYNLISTAGQIRFESNYQSHSHKWFLNEQEVSQDVTGNIEVPNGINTLAHEMKDELGNTTSASHVFYSHNNDIKWIFKTDLCIPYAMQSHYEHLLITYTENGEIYSTAFSEENQNHVFNIKNVEYFVDNNSSNAISIKFDIAFSGVLHNADKSKEKLFEDVVGTCKYKIE